MGAKNEDGRKMRQLIPGPLSTVVIELYPVYEWLKIPPPIHRKTPYGILAGKEESWEEALSTRDVHTTILSLLGENRGNGRPGLTSLRSPT